MGAIFVPLISIGVSLKKPLSFKEIIISTCPDNALFFLSDF
jgi:hypothetical protein